MSISWTEIRSNAGLVFSMMMELYGIAVEKRTIFLGPGIHTFRGVKKVGGHTEIFFSECDGRYWVGYDHDSMKRGNSGVMAIQEYMKLRQEHKNGTNQVGQGDGTGLPQSRHECKSAA